MADPDREKVLRERAQELVGAINAGECDGECILAALRQTGEEARAFEQEQHHALGNWANCNRCTMYYVQDQEAAYMCATVEDQVRTARAEGERAGREAEREASLRLVARVKRDLVRALESRGERLSTSDMIIACDAWATAIRARSKGGE